MTDNELKILISQNPGTLAKWHCELNSWKWIDELNPSEDYIGKELYQQPRRIEFMEWIEKAIGEREISYYWNVISSNRMTPEYFEQWWRDKETMRSGDFFDKYKIDIKTTPSPKKKSKFFKFFNRFL